MLNCQCGEHNAVELSAGRTWVSGLRVRLQRAFSFPSPLFTLSKIFE